MTSTTIVLLGRVLAPGPTLHYDADGLPRGQLTVQLDGAGVVAQVSTWGTHAKWVAARIFPHDLVLVRGAREAPRTGAVALTGATVVKLGASAAAVSAGARGG